MTTNALQSTGEDLLDNLQNSKGFGPMAKVKSKVDTTKPEPAQPAQEATDNVPPSSEEAVDWKKRHDDGRVYMEKLAKEKKELEDKLAGLQTPSIPDSPDEVEKLKEQNPELYEQVQSLIKKATEPTVTELESLRSVLKQKEEAEKNAALFKEILKVHPDAGEIRQSKEWLDWFNDQTELTRKLVESDNVKDIVRAISIFKQESGLGSPTAGVSSVSKSAEAAASFAGSGVSRMAPGSNKKIWAMSEIKALKPNEFSKFHNDIMLARQEGRIQFDA